VNLANKVNQQSVKRRRESTAGEPEKKLEPEKNEPKNRGN
jgi:hypothetical protein